MNLKPILYHVGALVCSLRGHLRGKAVGQTYVDAEGPRQTIIKCPRCGATWKRTYKRKKEQAE